MPTKLNKQAYQRLIDEDIEWLRAHVSAEDIKTCEGRHTVQVLEHSVKQDYEVEPALRRRVNHLAHWIQMIAGALDGVEKPIPNVACESTHQRALLMAIENKKLKAALKEAQAKADFVEGCSCLPADWSKPIVIETERVDGHTLKVKELDGDLGRAGTPAHVRSLLNGLGVDAALFTREQIETVEGLTESQKEALLS